MPDSPDTLPDWLQGDRRPLWRRPGPWLALAGLAAAAALGLWWRADRQAAQAPHYLTEAVTRGNVALTVSANGTLQPTRSVSIGSELSGTVAEVLVDVNDRVRKGQVLVRLDTSKLSDQVGKSRAALQAAQAALAQTRASAALAKASLARLDEVQRLSGGQLPAATELDNARATLDKARADEASAAAGVTQAQATLRTDETNLAKASIRSPIDGVVLTRAVEPGNAVAASLQAVTLFTLAPDLSKLLLSVNVDEADVGQVRVGQTAQFTVSAWAGRRYPATITRVAYGSTITDNVVTYTTQLQVDNPDLSLRPGMTATATIAATERTGVLLVPNTALGFQPAAAGAAPAAPSGGGSIVAQLMPRPPGMNQRKPGSGAPGARAGQPRQVWVLQDGTPVPLPVTVGLSNGRVTEVSGEGLKEGLEVITQQRSTPAK
ncbi:efflux RND transporter periplasmic adaptor subunit [Ideonella sp. 4Y16]|uniref:efflux RND transporter periplasmic adaptor subunit n=1 Tax=Ideonella alba TaxID=2824118 RepID=UPI001B3921D1|nr:efflux RND transporter periplasmic adaptor subunit [Ideonella alba]MBQ0943657.1 efflux RND transporter periplasmic adaptor subunit [Ideonella alba]